MFDVLNLRIYLWQWKISTFWKGYASSNGCCSIVMLAFGRVTYHKGTTLSKIFKKAFSGHLQECVAHLVQSWMSILIVRFQNTMLDILIAYEHRSRPKALKLSFCQIRLRIASIVNYTTRVLRINVEIHTKFGWLFSLILWRSFIYTHIWCGFLWDLLVSPNWFTLLRSDFDGVNVENADFTDVPLPCFATLSFVVNRIGELG